MMPPGKLHAAMIISYSYGISSLSILRTIMVEMVMQAPAIIWMACIRKANDLVFVSRMSAATLIIRMNATIDENRGDTTHDTIIIIS